MKITDYLKKNRNNLFQYVGTIWGRGGSFTDTGESFAVLLEECGYDAPLDSSEDPDYVFRNGSLVSLKSSETVLIPIDQETMPQP